MANEQTLAFFAEKHFAAIGAKLRIRADAGILATVGAKAARTFAGALAAFRAGSARGGRVARAGAQHKEHAKQQNQRQCLFHNRSSVTDFL